MNKKGITINNFDDATKDDSPERLKAILTTYSGATNSKYGNNVLLIHLINRIRKLDRTTTCLNGIMVLLIIVQVGMMIYQVYKH